MDSHFLLSYQEISLGMKIQDITGKTLLAKKVFVESIRYLKDHFLEIFSNKNLDTKITDILFVITVPAIWSDAAKQFMRVCSEMVCLFVLVKKSKNSVHMYFIIDYETVSSNGFGSFRKISSMQEKKT